ASSTRRALEPASARSLGVGRRPPDTFLRFSRFRFKEGKEAEGLDILRRHSAAIKSAPGCRDVWLAQGQHPATECVVVALFENEDSLRRLEGKLRSDPLRGGDFSALLSLTASSNGESLFELLSHSWGLGAATVLYSKRSYRGAAERSKGVVSSASIGVCANAGCFEFVEEWEAGKTDFETYTGKLAGFLEPKGYMDSGQFKRVLNAVYDFAMSWNAVASKAEQALAARAAI